MKTDQPKILFLTLHTFSLTGGIEKVTRALAKVLNDLKANLLINKYFVHSIYDDKPNEKYLPKSNFTGYKGNKIHFAFSTLLKAKQYNFIILSHINLLIIAWFIKKINSKTRIILLAHGIEVWRLSTGWKKKFLQSKCEIWAVSNFTADQLLKNEIPKANISVLNNCLDPYFKPSNSFLKSKELLKRYHLKDNQQILFTLTRLSAAEQYKGYDKVINIMPNLYRYPNLHYILAGKADEVELQRVKALIKACGVEDRVTLAGFIKDEEIADHYMLADIFVMPSNGEGFGISFIEAAACGCISIAGNLDGSKDALLNGKLGKLIDPADNIALEKTIAEILASPRSNEKSKLLQETCIHHFNYESYKRNVCDLLLENKIQLNAS